MKLAKPALPNKPSIQSHPRKPPTPKGVGGAGVPSPVAVPSPDKLTPREMVDFMMNESPTIIAAIQEGSGNVPRMLEDLVTLGEAITEQARGTSVQFRIRITKFRNHLSALKTHSTVTWYNSVQQIVEELNNLATSLEVISRNLTE